MVNRHQGDLLVSWVTPFYESPAVVLVKQPRGFRFEWVKVSRGWLCGVAVAAGEQLLDTFASDAYQAWAEAVGGEPAGGDVRGGRFRRTARVPLLWHGFRGQVRVLRQLFS